jgi:multidrug resistance efflux pump
MTDPIIRPTDSQIPDAQRPALLDAAGHSIPADPLPPPKIDRASWKVVVAMALVAVIGIMLICWAWQIGPFRSTVVTTENSYVRGQITVLAPQVNGYVANVMVRDYARVRAGQPLVQIDDRIYRQQLEQAQGQRAAAEVNLANVAQTEEQNQAEIEARRADLSSVQAELERAQADETRVNELAQRGSVSLRERDQIRAAARAATANVYKARMAIRIAQESAKSTGVSRNGLTAQIRTAEAQVKLAQINLDNTLIRAPRDGQLSESGVRQGQYVTAGSQLMFLVPDLQWVIANYKETQVRDIRAGQVATFAVDALGEARLTGRVEGFAPATGSEFSVLRPDNASGNFTKVVQRLPVRIAIDPNQPLAARLRPGMSVVTSIDTVGAATGGQP